MRTLNRRLFMQRLTERGGSRPYEWLAVTANVSAATARALAKGVHKTVPTFPVMERIAKALDCPVLELWLDAPAAQERRPTKATSAAL